MNRIDARLLIVALSLCLTIGGAVSLAQAPTEANDGVQPAATSETRQAAALAVRQVRVRQLLAQMQTRFQALATSLAESEPEQAARLSAALDQSRQRLLEQQMQQAATLLEQGRLDDASDLQQQVVKELQALARVLVEEEPDPATLFAEQQRLEQWREQLALLRHEEQLQQRESELLIDKPGSLARFQQQAAAAADLATTQQTLTEQTTAATQRGIEALPELANTQQALLKQAETLLQPLLPRRPDEKISPSKLSPAPPDRQSEPLHPAPPVPGALPLVEAALHQQAAADQLRESLGQGAIAEQRLAAAALKTASEQLRREQDRLAALPADATSRHAMRQQNTLTQAAEFAEQISALIAAGATDDGEEDPAALTRAKTLQHVRQAETAMRQAITQLQENETAVAADRQQQAVTELLAAEQAVEQRLAQLRDESPADKAARLADHFRELLVRQQAATAKTVELGEQFAGGGKLGRGERIALKKLTEEEQTLSDVVRQSQVTILTEGSSVVLPRVVGQVADDLATVATRLTETQLDRYTQTIQREIEQTLEQLIATLDKSAAESRQNPPPPADPPMPENADQENQPAEPPLLPGLAEIKLLRAAQQRINRRTAAVAALRGEGPLDEALTAELARLAELQTITAAMAEELIIRFATSGRQ